MNWLLGALTLLIILIWFILAWALSFSIFGLDLILGFFGFLSLLWLIILGISGFALFCCLQIIRA